MYSILFIVLVLWSISSSCTSLDSDTSLDYDTELSQEFKQEEQDTLSQLDIEAQKTYLNHVWEETLYTYTKLGSLTDLKKKYRKSEILNEGEIRILKSYCMESDFYRDLNADLRNNDGEYPVTTKVMNAALTKLRKYQLLEEKQVLSDVLYRNEPIEPQFSIYQNLLKSSKNGVLKQFTSTSKQFDIAKKFNIGSDRMITKFKDLQLGASIADFSKHNECEVLLPVSGVYTVKTATKDEDNNYNVVLIGPGSASINKHNSNIFIIFVSALIIKLV